MVMRAGSSSFGCVSNISRYVALIIGVGLQGRQLIGEAAGRTWRGGVDGTVPGNILTAGKVPTISNPIVSV